MTFPHSATIQRKSHSGGKYTFADSSTTSCFLQPVQDEKAQLMGIAFGKAFRCYVPETTDLQEADRMVINGTTYGVKGVSYFNYGTISHKRAALEAL